MSKYIGDVSAYAYAVSKGYAGTEEEFAELMADYAEVGQRAEDAADRAEAAKTAAQTAATTATNKASEATTAAQTATTKAGEASQSASQASGSAQTASNKASEASQSASTASAKATEATTAAETATTAKNDAVSAKTAAETAQGKAETAQGAAEDAAESVSASAAQIATNTADIAELQEDKVSKADFYSAFPTDSAQGAIASFTDGAELPLKSLTVDIEPIQDLHGYDNPWPAGGGKNLLDPSYFGRFPNIYDVNEDGTLTVKLSDGNAWTAVPIITLPAGTYTLSYTAPSGNVRMRTSEDDYATEITVYTTKTFTLGTDVGIRLKVGVTGTYPFVCKTQIESGSTATAYAPYSNICPISGHTQAVVTRTGVNVWDEEWELGIYSLSDGLPVQNASSIRGKNRIVAKPSTDYYCNNNNIRVLYYDESDNYLGFVGGLGIKTTPTNCAYIRMYLGNDYGTTYNHDVCINHPSTDNDYHPHDIQSVTIPLGQTVYGGTLDVTNGVLTVDRAMVIFSDGTGWSVSLSSGHYRAYTYALTDILPWNDGTHATTTMICDRLSAGSWEDIFVGTAVLGQTNKAIGFGTDSLGITDETSLGAWLANNPLTICYKLATPITVTLTPNELSTLLGANNIWSDAGEVTAEYRADPTLYIQRKIAEALS